MPAGKIYRKPKIFKKIHSLCFGVNDYKNIQKLRGCINDIKAIHGLLSQNKGGTHRILEEAERGEIFAELSLLLKELKEGELLIIHGSGHGTLYHNEFYYLPREASQENILGTGIPIYPLIKALSSHAQKGCKVLLMLDTCHAGGVSFDISTYQGEFKGGISCIFSSIAKEASYEIEIENIYRGLFSYFIEQGLRGKAINYGFTTKEEREQIKSGLVKLIDLYDYAYDHVSQHHSQFPLLIGTLDSDTIIHEVKNQETF